LLVLEAWQPNRDATKVADIKIRQSRTYCDFIEIDGAEHVIEEQMINKASNRNGSHHVVINEGGLGENSSTIICQRNSDFGEYG